MGQQISILKALAEAIVQTLNAEEAFVADLAAHRRYVPVATQSELDEANPGAIAIVLPSQQEEEYETRGGNVMRPHMQIAVQAVMSKSDTERGDMLILLTEQVLAHLRRLDIEIEIPGDGTIECLATGAAIEAAWDWERIDTHGTWLSIVRMEYEVVFE